MADERDLVAAVRLAVEAGLTVRAVGSGHSWSAVAVTDGILLDFSRYREVVAVDHRASTVTVEAGCTLRRLNRELARRGLALENLGDVAAQSVAGAIATGTHGTGLRFGGLATSVVGMRVVLGTGQVVDCDRQRNPRLFHSARVGLGALGLISTVTLRCVPAFGVHACEELLPVGDVLGQWDELTAADHFEFSWVPRTPVAWARTNTHTHAPLSPRSPWQAWRDDVVIENLGLGLLGRAGRWRNDLIPTVSRRLPPRGRVDYTDRSDRVFTGPRLLRYVEMEYAIPVDVVPEAMLRMRSLVEQLGVYVALPVQVRTSAPDDIPLSPATARPSGYVAVRMVRGEPWERYFRGVEAIMDAYDGRPHWGKLHFQTAETLAPRYPEWDRVQELRTKVDPHGVFSTDHVRRVLGEGRVDRGPAARVPAADTA